jgi:hypothetical protein
MITNNNYLFENILNKMKFKNYLNIDSENELYRNDFIIENRQK